jgi:LysM repeat protein
MRINFFQTSLLVACLGMAAALHADNKIYLLYDASCMNKHESWFTRNGVQTAGDAPLVQYALQSNDDNKVFLEMSAERPGKLENAPKNIKKCSEMRWDEALIREINQGKTDVFLVWPNTKGYASAAVATAAIMTMQGSILHYSDRDFNFSIDTKAPFQADNLADRESDYLVMKKDYFERECEPIYVLHREAKKTCETATDFEFSPKFGIIQENTGRNASEMAENQLNLYLVNGESFIDALKKSCSAGAKSTYSMNAPVIYSTGTTSYSAAEMANLPVSEIVIMGQESTTTAQSVAVSQPVTYNQIDETRDKEMSAGGGYRRTTFAQPTTETASISANSVCANPEKPGFHLVQRGDNLYRIARQYGLSVANLKGMNGMKSDEISACAYLAIDGQTPISAPKPAELSVSSTVSPRKVSQSTAVSKPLVAGGGVKTTAAAASIPKKSTAQIVVSSTDFHVIQSGENLTLLGEAYNMTATDIAKLNGIDRNTILYPGQKLRMRGQKMASEAPKAVEYSTPKPTGATFVTGGNCYHSVLEGDNLSKIARFYGYTLERVMRINNFSDEKMMLQVGQKILVNDCECNNENAPKTTSAEPRAVQTSLETAVAPVVYDYASTTIQPASVRYIHRVSDGETQFSISKKYEMTVERLREINNLETGGQLVPGQSVIVE